MKHYLKVFFISLIAVSLLLSSCTGKNDISAGESIEVSGPLLESENDALSISEDEDAEDEPVIEVSGPVIEEIDLIPDEDFMETFVFPDVLGEVNNATVVNSVIGYKGYKGQGSLYVYVDENVESYDLFINDIRIDTGNIKKPCFHIDASDISKNGINSVQVTNIRPADMKEAVKIYVEYPGILTGTPEEAGINPEVFTLIDNIVRTDVEYGFPSAQLAVIKDGRLIYSNAWGYLNNYNEDLTPIEGKIPVTTDTLYDLASNTKMYSINYMVQYLVSRGELDINEKVIDIIGNRFADLTVDVDYKGQINPGLETVKSWKSMITVKDLLCHTAGFPSSPKYEIPNYDFKEARIVDDHINPLYTEPLGWDSTLYSICKTPTYYAPGSKVVYSDVDYMLLFFILDQRIDISLKEIFFEPMGLNRITYNPLDNGFSKEDCAATELKGNTREGRVYFDGIRDYTLQGEVHDEMAYFTMNGISGHAGLFSNAEDLAKLATLMLTGGYNGHTYFSREVIDTFTSPVSEDLADWGIGWWRNGGEEGRPWYFSTESGDDNFGHQGWTGTLTVIDPNEDMVIVYLTNKINSPLVDKYGSTSKFEGGVFTSGSLGFSTELIYRGLNKCDADIHDSLLSLSADMVAESIKLISVNGGKNPDADSAAVRNAYSKMDVLISLYETDKTDEAKQYVEEALKLFDETRDSEALAEFRERINN